jgi:pentose-5-phosphate-3-epimerase
MMYHNTSSEVEIVPAVLVRSKDELEQELARLRGVATSVQVDLVGRNYLEGEESFPQWDEFDFEVDLMTRDPVRDAEAVVQSGAARVVVHAEGHYREALQSLQKYRAGEYAVKVGVALHPGDTAGLLKDIEGQYDYVQVMGIAREGAQGQPGDERAVGLVRALRAAYPGLVIQVDGAVAPRVKEFVAAGANRLVVGSAIVQAADPRAAYEALLSQAVSARR